MGTDWIDLCGFFDPPPPPEGYDIEFMRDTYLGIVIAYRFVKKEKND